MTVALPPDLRAAVGRLAATGTLLVASDYDGVLAPIVNDPAKAFPLPAAIDALQELATLPRTSIALLSGRALVDLARLSGLGGEALLVGTHGVEFDDGFAIPPEAAALRARLLDELRPMVAAVPGAALEEKIASVAVHIRNADPDAGEKLLAGVTDGPGSWPGVHSTAGKKVLELAVVKTSKGTALDVLRERTGADAVLFAGDDVTDEKAFAVLRAGDVGVKVGPGETAAEYRVDDPEQIVGAFALLAEERRLHVGT
ncbi:trehalose-phosphatase [Cryptosporangium minutisporangium]|uniref:Trehalose 6-phosphate phosphatase n=1 Tax=Cryptosporangium minutisporangium TaxID=113569 RepID=A0ABP6T629_9ACTN